MDEKPSQGLQKRIDFFGRWAFAFFTAFLVLLGWLGTNIRVEKYDIVFVVGASGAAFFGIASLTFAWITYRNIKRLDALENVRN